MSSKRRKGNGNDINNDKVSFLVSEERRERKKVMNFSHCLHSSQANGLLRSWMSAGNERFSPTEFVLPLFIINDDEREEPIDSMPNVNRYGVNKAIAYLKELVNQYSLAAVLLFPVMKVKGLANSLNENENPVLRLIPKLKKIYPQLTVVTDVCLCGFNEDGHCCVFNKHEHNTVINDEESLLLISRIALQYAKCGADVIAPSDMNDCRVHAIREALRENGYTNVAIMSYSAKFASCFYGPFRDAAGSAPAFGDRKCYQLPPGAAGLGMRAIERDIKESTDIVMVKPGLPYLDIIARSSIMFPNIPIAVYHVSGEYAMLIHGANNNAYNLKDAIFEVMTSFKRAGVTVIITYFTPSILKWLKEDK